MFLVFTSSLPRDAICHAVAVSLQILSMAWLLVDGHSIPLVFPILDSGLARVACHLLHVRFRFVETSIYIEEEKWSESGEVLQSVLVVKLVEDGTHC